MLASTAVFYATLNLFYASTADRAPAQLASVDGRACKALWDAKELAYSEQRDARGRAVLAQCPLAGAPSATAAAAAAAARCALPLARSPRKPGDLIAARGMHVRAAWNMYEPEWMCESDERLGARVEATPDTGPTGTAVERRAAFGDGPKWVCALDALANRTCLVYSIGSHNDFGFEKALKLVHPHCDVHTFDPTLGLIPGDGGPAFLGREYSTFHDLGLGEPPARAATVAAEAEPWRRKLLPWRELVRALGHVGKTVDILKVDCEGCEWDALRPVFDDLADGRLRVGQLLLELHLRQATTQADVDGFVARADRAGLRISHKEPNVLHGDGFSAIEYAFVHRAFACTAFVLSHCPGASSAGVCGGDD